MRSRDEIPALPGSSGPASNASLDNRLRRGDVPLGSRRTRRRAAVSTRGRDAAGPATPATIATVAGLLRHLILLSWSGTGGAASYLSPRRERRLVGYESASQGTDIS